MKKALLLMLLLLFLPLCAQADTQAVVANRNVADRLILRETASSSGKILGRFYTGTPVTVLEKGEEFCHVKIGGLEGYMMTVYLAFPVRNYAFDTLYYTAQPNRKDAPLYHKASTAGNVTARANEPVYVLGDINDDWRYVQLQNGEYGFMRAIHLNSTKLMMNNAYLSTRVELFSDKKMTRKTGAVYEPNTRVRVVDASRNGNWAKIEITGMHLEPNMPGDGVSGYISQDYLNLFLFPWETGAYSLRAGILQKDYALYSPWDETTQYLKEGTMVAIMGETEDSYHLVSDVATALVEKEMVFPLQNQKANRHGHVERIGFALLKEGDERRWTYNSLNQLIQQNGDQLQIYSGHGVYMEWMDAKDVILLKEGDLLKFLPPLPEGEFAITQENSAIWHFEVKEGKTATLSMKNETWNIAIDQKTFTEGSYSYFLPEGTTGTLQGAAWQSSKAQLSNINLSYCQEYLGENTPVFQGSGRLFCDWQITDRHSFYSFKVKPLPGCEEAYFSVSSLNTLEKDEPGEHKVDLFNLTYEEEDILYVLPGNFVELVNCQLYYDFGNG